jgi:hypothetical protein
MRRTRIDELFDELAAWQRNNPKPLGEYDPTTDCPPALTELKTYCHAIGEIFTQARQWEAGIHIISVEMEVVTYFEQDFAEQCCKTSPLLAVCQSHGAALNLCNHKDAQERWDELFELEKKKLHRLRARTGKVHCVRKEMMFLLRQGKLVLAKQSIEDVKSELEWLKSKCKQAQSQAPRSITLITQRTQLP